MLRVGLVGYGVGGRLFHAPYIQASERCSLAGVVARSPQRVAEAAKDLPDTPIHESLSSLLESGVDAVVVSTPPQTRSALVREAIRGGVHVIADKPFAPDGDEGLILADAARRAGVILNVFHNRRWDPDIVTAQQVVKSGRLGTVTRLDLRCDQNDSSTLEQGPRGGLLLDLGSHLVDQAMLLLGPVASVHAVLEKRHMSAGPTDVAFHLSMKHARGAWSFLSASKLAHLASRELRLHGTEHSYASNYSDVQIDAVLAGRRPADHPATWGVEDQSRWGREYGPSGVDAVPSLQGNYTAFYDQLASAVLDGAREPVPASQGVRVLRVLDAARRSARTAQTVPVYLT